MSPAAEHVVADDSEGKSPFETCYSTFSPSGDPTADLSRLVRTCGPMGGMRAVTEVHRGTQDERDPVERFSFRVPEAGKCYRIYAVGGSGVKDLDLLLRGENGDAFVADLSHDSWPVVPPREPICLQEPGIYLLEVSVSQGAGPYALQVWGR